MQASVTAILMVFAAIKPGVFATPMNETGAAPLGLSGFGYATFYDDDACKVNPGKAVSMGNSGCLANEVGRNSIYIQPGATGNPSLVWSPGKECNCQNECKPVKYNDGVNYCWPLTGNEPAQSFRFINQACGPNNCS